MSLGIYFLQRWWIEMMKLDIKLTIWTLNPDPLLRSLVFYKWPVSLIRLGANWWYCQVRTAKQSLSGEPWKCAMCLNTSLLFHNPYCTSCKNYVLHSHGAVHEFNTSILWNRFMIFTTSRYLRITLAAMKLKTDGSWTLVSYNTEGFYSMFAL